MHSIMYTSSTSVTCLLFYFRLLSLLYTFLSFLSFSSFPFRGNASSRQAVKPWNPLSLEAQRRGGRSVSFPRFSFCL